MLCARANGEAFVSASMCLRLRRALMAVFILEDALCVWTNLGKHSLFVWLFVSSVKTGKRRIIRPDELSSVVRRLSRTTADSSSRRIMRRVLVFTLETNNQTNNECLPKFVQTHNASSSIKTANHFRYVQDCTQLDRASPFLPSHFSLTSASCTCENYRR